jgi:hypothetical protein
MRRAILFVLWLNGCAQSEVAQNPQGAPELARFFAVFQIADKAKPRAGYQRQICLFHSQVLSALLNELSERFRCHGFQTNWLRWFFNEILPIGKIYRD